MRKIVAGAVLVAAVACGGSSSSGTGSTGTGTTPTAPTPPTAPTTANLSISVTGAGAITADGQAIDCRGNCTSALAIGTAVHLIATADQGNVFSGWAGACSGTANCDVTVSADASVSATFTASTITPTPTPTPPPPAPTPVPPTPPPADDCAGLVPAAPGAPTATHSTAYPDRVNVLSCSSGAADGDGDLLFRVADGGRPGTNIELDFVSPQGSSYTSNAGSGSEVAITEQLHGYVAQTGPESVLMEALSGKGNSGAATSQFFTDLDHVGSTVDPTGGAMVFETNQDQSQIWLRSYDAAINLRWRVQVPAKLVGGFAVDRAGNALVLVDGDLNTVDAYWVSHDGVVGGEFRVAAQLPGDTVPHQTSFTFGERVGSGLFFGANNAWLASVDSLAQKGNAPPSWLASRTLSEMHVVHGGKGYAMLPNPADGDCAQTIDVISPSGKTCGSRTFRAADGTCSTGSVHVGYDGTVIQQVPPTFCTGANCACTWHWWTGYFH